MLGKPGVSHFLVWDGDDEVVFSAGGLCEARQIPTLSPCNSIAVAVSHGLSRNPFILALTAYPGTDHHRLCPIDAYKFRTRLGIELEAR